MLVSRGAKQRFKETEPDESVHLTILVRVLLPQPPSAEKNERQGGGGKVVTGIERQTGPSALS